MTPFKPFGHHVVKLPDGFKTRTYTKKWYGGTVARLRTKQRTALCA